MKQPELGIKIVELRKQKGLTQEDLAAECNLNVRSIQRIEKGEVVPRDYTLNILSNVLEFDFRQFDNISESSRKLWIIILHLSNLMPVVIVPLIIMLLKKDEIPGIEKHCRDIINFQVSICIYMIISAFLVFLVIGVLILIAIGIYIGIITLINIIKVATGKDYSYPFTMNIISV